MDGFDAALARYRAFLASEPIAPLLRRSLALFVPDNIRIDTVTPDDSLRCTTDGTSVTVGGAAYLLRADFDARHWTAALRVLLARALCATRKLLLLDEPVTGLDPVATGELYNLIKLVNLCNDITVIMVTHDIDAALRYATHVLHLGHRQLFYGTAADYKQSDAARRFLGGRKV